MSQATALSVNLNKIALLRNSREGSYPSVVAHAQVCLDAGADGITVHPRPDQRHIRPSDVMDLTSLVAPLDGIEFNVEGNPFAGPQGSYPGFMELVAQSQPDQCTLVPDSDDQLTSDHGFNLKQSGARLEPIIQRLKDQGCRISLFMDPDPEQIRLAKNVGADRIELYTGPYAEAFGQQSDNLDNLFQTYVEAAETAAEQGLGLNAGHDLNLENLPRFRQVKDLLEVSIGHALTVDSIAMGMAEAVKRYRAICQA
ncbi:pyridoxine 5'-phosphate synthase [Pseudomaricurvus alkylphenolicus]|uniref:pyridoxine 5'-phosphate synthase n=1 Tax=Pseudomaricurvus alkylphenolicus TaxID=1306991 RepID=UPI001422BE60|nr:pyridoxine 5'-phosphate synthase [Pseudomaricurvus alkylphenolicus]NIB41312.1 pyridoxine 5'-phosphate synthase [Pseudomaricurvus alkylphenolicus]